MSRDREQFEELVVAFARSLLGFIEEVLATPTGTITPADALEADYDDFGPSHRVFAWGMAELIRRAMARHPGDPERISLNPRHSRSNRQ